MAEDLEKDRLGAALRFVLRRYVAQVRRWPLLAAGAFLLPAVGDVLTLYAPPLVVARLLGVFASNRQLTADELQPYILTFVALWVSGQIVWRIGVALIARVEIRALEALYIEAMDELLAKDLAFFHNNYAGSLTKRALGFARRFEDVFDVMAFQVSASFLPLGFAGVVLWQYSPWLIVVLVGMLLTTFGLMVPLIRRRRKLVDIRETASNLLAGSVIPTALPGDRSSDAPVTLHGAVALTSGVAGPNPASARAEGSGTPAGGRVSGRPGGRAAAARARGPGGTEQPARLFLKRRAACPHALGPLA